MIKPFTKFALMLAMLAFGSLALSQDDRAAQAEEQIRQVLERLDLTDEQIEQVKPILENSFESRRAVMASYGIDIESREGGGEKLGLRKARSMRRDLDKIQEDTNAELKEILSAEQFDELEIIQQERRDQMRERIRSSR